jgi:hypothetical protein
MLKNSKSLDTEETAGIPQPPPAPGDKRVEKVNMLRQGNARDCNSNCLALAMTQTTTLPYLEIAARSIPKKCHFYFRHQIQTAGLDGTKKEIVANRT